MRVLRKPALMLAASLIALASLTSPAWAPAMAQNKNNSNNSSQNLRGGMHKCPHCGHTLGADALVAMPANTLSATFDNGNFGATLEPGEPTEGGLMTRTLWDRYSAPQNRRVVIHTFGSDIDTVLAVYRNDALPNLVRVAGNDNRALAGVSNVHSLVQFDAAANVPYRIQLGSRNGAEGDVYTNIYDFPPGGGLSAFLVRYAGNKVQNSDYVCTLSYTSASTCPAATFVVHNSTAQTLSITPFATLGGALRNPASFSLLPGQLKAVTFTYNPAFDQTSFRTIAGHFTFTGRVGSTVAAQFAYRGLVVVKSRTGYGPDVLRFSTVHQLRAGLICEALDFDILLRNAGDGPARGCHARADDYSRQKVFWQTRNPANGALGPVRGAVTIPAGGSQSLRVVVASQEPREAAPDASGDIIVDCANTAEAPIGVNNRFDLSTVDMIDPADVTTVSLAPTTGILNVPASGTAKFRVAATNRGPTGRIEVEGAYVGWYEDEPNERFVVTGVCAANSDGSCTGPIAPSVLYTAPSGQTRYFNAFVRAPAVAPNFDPTRRRVFMFFRHEMPATVSTNYLPVGARSVAVRKL